MTSNAKRLSSRAAVLLLPTTPKPNRQTSAMGLSDCRGEDRLEPVPCP